MSAVRLIEAELLDALSPEDPRAIRARTDLARVNAVMGHTAIWKRLLENIFPAGQRPAVIADLGTGDGTLLLKLARAWAPAWPDVRVQLVDRRPAVSGETLQAFAALGWRAETVAADAGTWAADAAKADLVMANLFLHHLEDASLAELLQRIAGKTKFFAACEPRRSGVALAGSHLLGLIGCGPVTRYDAVVSVRAGFRGKELSALWPGPASWRLNEGGAGLFTHFFMARRL